MTEQTATREKASASNGHGTAKTIEVSNPATGEHIATVAALNGEGIAEVVARARAAQPGWQALGFEGRARVLRRTQKWVLDNRDRLARTIVAETGKAYEDAQMAEISYVASAFGFWAKNAPKYLADEKIRASSPFVLGRKLTVRYEPVGVVGVIGPWNYPLTNSFGDCIPALAAGNATVLKPATLTPMTSLLMLEGLQECGMPDGVHQVAVGEGSEVGNSLIDAVDFVMFTGSTEVGIKVAERAAKTLTPVGLELGGKDPMIVCADANLERAANAAVYYSMQNGGQTCISTERVYVEAPVYDEFVVKVTEKVKELRQGVPGDPGVVDVGAVTSPPQVELIDSHVRDATEKGARVLSGGRPREGAGDFYEPTLLVDVDHSMECMTEETFGPTLPVMKVPDIDEAVRLSNDSPYGLQASVWTKDAGKGEQIARRIEAGAVCVNDSQINYVALELPMGGWKTSGVGSRHGADGIRKYARKQSLLVTRWGPNRDIHMFPYKSWTTRLLGRAFELIWGRGKRD
ncbi:MAG: succinic semialdehyde dehydrogenase [Solirubrobacterales bacterium]